MTSNHHSNAETEEGQGPGNEVEPSDVSEGAQRAVSDEVISEFDGLTHLSDEDNLPEDDISGEPADGPEEARESHLDDVGGSDGGNDDGDEAGEAPAPAIPPLLDHGSLLRMAEALLFAAAEPLDVDSLAARLPKGADVGALIEDIQTLYANRGVNLVRVANKWMFRTAEDLAHLMQRQAVETRKLSRPALETLAIIAYHQPVTRAEIEEIRGVSVSKGTVDVLMETGWVRLRGRRRTPGRPVTYGTTEAFLIHYGLESISDLPGLDELKAAGLLEGRLPSGFEIPNPSDAGGEGDGEFGDDAQEEYGLAIDEHLAALPVDDAPVPDAGDVAGDATEPERDEADVAADLNEPGPDGGFDDAEEAFENEDEDGSDKPA